MEKICKRKGGPDGAPRPVEVPLSDLPILLGVTSEGKPITLIDCFAAKASGIPGVTKTSQVFIPRIVCYDVHFDGVGDFRLTSLCTRYSNLDEWAATSGFEVSVSGKGGYPLGVSYEQPKEVEAQLSNGLKVGIYFSASADFGSLPKEMRTQQEAWLGVSASDERPYEELLRTLSTVADFIALGIGQPIRPLECKATACDSATTEEPRKSLPIRLHHNEEFVAPLLPDVHARDMAFTLHEVKDRFGSFLESWCSQDEKIKPLYSLYFGTLRSSRMYVEHRFLNMFQALEAFHRRDHVRSEEVVRKRADRLKRITDAVKVGGAPGCGKDAKWLQKNHSRLLDLSEPAAADRIRQLVKECDATWIFEDWESDMTLASNFRNFYTHYDVRLTDRLPPLHERPRVIHNLAVRLQLLCEIVLLQQVGFKSAELRDRMTQRLNRRLAR